MALSELVKTLQEKAIRQRQEESRLLGGIAELSNHETAETAAALYAPEKHAYSFDGYLYQLKKLQTLLAAGIPAEQAIEAVDNCIDAAEIINYYKGRMEI